MISGGEVGEHLLKACEKFVKADKGGEFLDNGGFMGAR